MTEDINWMILQMRNNADFCGKCGLKLLVNDQAMYYCSNCGKIIDYKPTMKFIVENRLGPQHQINLDAESRIKALEDKIELLQAKITILEGN